MFRTLSRVLLGASLLLASLSFSDAQNLLGINYDSGTLYSVSTATAALTPIGATGVSQFADIQFAPNGTLYGFTSSLTTTSQGFLYTINPTTAQATQVGSIGLGQVTEGGLAIAPNGTAYATAVSGGAGAIDLFSINLNTGAGTIIGTLSGGVGDVNALAYRSDGQLVGVDRQSNALIVINPNTAAVSTLAVLSQQVGVVGGMTLVNGEGYFNTGGPNPIFPGSNSLYSFDPFTGANSLIGSFSATITTGNGISGITAIPAAPASTPEPGSIALIVSLGVGVGFFARRKKRCKES